MNKVIVIAEAGVNHNGEMEKAFELIRGAKDAGADYVKFQTFKAKELVTKKAKMAQYQKENCQKEESQYEMIKKLELSRAQHLALVDYCNKIGIKFLSTPFDKPSVDFLKTLNLDFFKVPSGEVTNIPYLRWVADAANKIVMSTGMCTIEEIEVALQILRGKNITLLHCNTEYPTPMEDVNLLAMVKMKEKFKVNVGYSDHTLGIEVPIAAVALGATIIEKHFTLSRNLEGPDHKASLEPEELKQMIKSIRNIELALGSGIKAPSNSEKKNIEIARKSIIAKCDIKKGEIFSEKNLNVKRPGHGISPINWDKLLGKTSLKDYSQEDLIEINELR